MARLSAAAALAALALWSPALAQPRVTPSYPCEQHVAAALAKQEASRCTDDNRVRPRVLEALIRRAAARTVVPNDIDIAGIRVDGPVTLAGVNIRGRLALTDSLFDCGGAVAESECSVDLSNVKATDVDFHGSVVHRIVAEHLQTTGSVDFSHGFRSKQLHLVDADIGGFLSFDGATLTNPGGTVITGDGMRVRSSVTFRAGFVSEGEVRLLRVQIGRDLDAHGGAFLGPADTVLDVQGSTIGSDVLLYRDDGKDFQKNFVAGGPVALFNSSIAGNLILDNAEFRPGSSLDLHATAVGGALTWKACDRAPVDHAMVNVEDASVGTLNDTQQCWPAPGHIVLDGFRYRRFGREAPRDVDARLQWIWRQPNLPPNVYRQLAAVLSEAGDLDGWRKVSIKGEFARRASQGAWLGWAWNWILALTVGYGYAVWRAGLWSLVILPLGALLFARAYRDGGIYPTDDEAGEAFINRREPVTYRPFSAPMYAIDSFLPIINFGQKERWEPNAKTGAVWGVRSFRRPAGWWARAYLWLHTALGWVLTTLFVAGMTGIVKSG